MVEEASDGGGSKCGLHNVGGKMEREVWYETRGRCVGGVGNWICCRDRSFFRNNKEQTA